MVNDEKAIEHLSKSQIRNKMTPSAETKGQQQSLHTEVVSEMKMGEATKIVNDKDIGPGVMENMDDMLKNYGEIMEDENDDDFDDDSHDQYFENHQTNGAERYQNEQSHDSEYHNFNEEHYSNVDDDDDDDDRSDEEDHDMKKSHSHGYGYAHGAPLYDYYGYPYIIKPCHKLFGCKFSKWFW